MMNRRTAALLLAVVMAFSLCACGLFGEQPSDDPGQTSQPPVHTPGESETPSVSESPTVPPEDKPSEEPTELPTEPVAEDRVRLGVLAGPADIGAAKLLADSDAGETLNRYAYTFAADNDELMAGLVGEKPAFDIAMVASNVALSMYNSTGGDVKIIALGTRGALHILEGGGGKMVETVADLEGETVYLSGEGTNPEYILRYLLAQRGLDPDEDVDLVFADSEEIAAKLLTGEIRYAMLPVPAATAVIAGSEGQVRSAVDVTEAWDRLGSGGQLIMTAVVARQAFIEADPQAVADFLKEYAASIDYVNENSDEAAALIVGFGIAPDEEIAKQAIPQCHLTCIAGRSMAGAISDYFMVLYEVDPAAVGGKLPDDAIYYVP